MQRLEIWILKALYESIDPKKYRKRKAKLIYDWKVKVNQETGKMPKSKDRMYDVLNGAENSLPFEVEFLNDRIQKEYIEIFGEENFNEKVESLRLESLPY